MPFPARAPVSVFPARWKDFLLASRDAFSAQLGNYGSAQIGAALILRDPSPRWLATVFWAQTMEQDGAPNILEIAVSPRCSFAPQRIRSDEIARWVSKEAEAWPARSHHVGDRGGAWPTVGFRTEAQALEFLRRVGEARTGIVRAGESYPTPLEPYAISQSGKQGVPFGSDALALPEGEEWLLRHLAAIEGHDPTDQRVRRVGQKLLRRLLLRRRGHACEVTGMRLKQLLRCSHIKPWAAAAKPERTDVENCLLLAAHWDAAFDQGLVSFDDDGRMLVGAALQASPACGRLLLANHDRLAKRPSVAMARYLGWHREHIFKP